LGHTVYENRESERLVYEQDAAMLGLA
jgi:hypothetical protein